MNPYKWEKLKENRCPVTYCTGKVCQSYQYINILYCDQCMFQIAKGDYEKHTK